MLPAPPLGKRADSRSLAGPNDIELLRRFSAGEQLGAQQFVRRFQSPVYGLALRVLQDPGRAQDVAQEAFERAWRRAPTFNPDRGSVSAWLLGITRNLAIDQLRRRRPDLVGPQSTDRSVDPLNAAVDPGEAIVASADMAEVARALAHLPTEQRRAVLLASYGGLTAKEISQREGIPLGTAKTRIHRGLRQVRTMLTNTDETAAG